MGLAWLKGHAAEMGGDALLLIQGYEWIGFARWRNGDFELPPGAPFEWQFTEMWDLRLFSETTEWHCWKTGDGTWRARLAKAADWRDFELRDYVVWGRQEPAREDAWTNLSEANGVSIYVPIEVAGDLKLAPVRLSARLAVDYDNDGLAYISDVMLHRLYQKEGA
jgi:CRISPR-associated protein (TIGR03984 family)